MAGEPLTVSACEGAAGKDGAAGAAGADGVAGEAGAPGSGGTAGADGAPGAAGSDGSTGTPDDADGDGVSVVEDCDDTDATILGPSSFYIDYDGDGYGHPGVVQALCAPLVGWVDNAGDCDDLDAGVSPEATEVCDTVDKQGPRLEGRGSQDAERLLRWPHRRRRPRARPIHQHAALCGHRRRWLRRRQHHAGRGLCGAVRLRPPGGGLRRHRRHREPGGGRGV